MSGLLPVALALLPCALRGASAQDAPPGPAHIGYFAHELGELGQPVAAAFSARGEALVVEAGRGAIARFDAAGKLLGRIALATADPLLELSGIALHQDGRILVSDANGARILVLAPSGERIASLGERGLAPGRLHRPLGLDVAEDLVAVADAGNHRVEIFHLDGRHLLSIGEHGRAPGRFIRPADVAFGPERTLFVADEGNARVQVFDAQGRFLRAFGDFGPFPGLFAGPTAIELAAGRVHVCDRANHRVQVFDLEGRALYEWGEHAVMPFDGAGRLHYPTGLALSPAADRALVVESVDQRCQLFVSDAAKGSGERLVPRLGAGTGSAHYGEELALGGRWLAIAAPEDHTVLVFETSWKQPRLVAHAGELGDGPGLFLRPHGLALDGARGILAVSDPDLRRISLLQLADFGEREVGYDPFLWRFQKCLDLERLNALLASPFEAVPEPGALARDSQGRLYVCDLRNDRVLVLSAELELLRSFGRSGTGLGELRRPSGLALSADENRLLVVDSGNARVQCIELESGRFVPRTFRVETSEASSTFELAWFEPRPSVPAEKELLPRLHGIARGAEGYCISDAWNERVHVLRTEGRVERFGARGLGRGELRGPRGLAFDGEGRLHVLEHANHRVQVFDASGAHLMVYGSRPFLEPALGAGAPARSESEQSDE